MHLFCFVNVVFSVHLKRSLLIKAAHIISAMVQALLESPVQNPAPVLKPAYSNLLQELTYALAGITGDVFVDTHEGGVESSHRIRSPSRSTFKINPEADWLSSCDRKQIESLLSLGFHYFEIDQFVQQQSNGSLGLCWPGLRLGLEGEHRAKTHAKDLLQLLIATFACRTPLPRLSTGC
jgi:hypothetical protein